MNKNILLIRKKGKKENLEDYHRTVKLINNNHKELFSMYNPKDTLENLKV